MSQMEQGKAARAGSLQTASSPLGETGMPRFLRSQCSKMWSDMWSGPDTWPYPNSTLTKP